MPARRPLRLGAALIAATLVLAPAPALALQSAGGGAAQAEADKTADIDFPGGTVAEYIETLRRAFDGEPRNVLMDEETASRELGNARMRAMTLEGALRLMSDIFPDRGVRSSIRVSERPGYLVVEHVMSPFVSEDVPSNQTRVFSIRGIISPATDEDAAALRTEDILTAVELVIMASSPRAEPEIRFHPETGMLIVAAPRTSLSVVTEAIDLMTRDTQTLREQAAAARRAGPEGRLEAVLKDDVGDPELRLIELKGFLQTAELKLEQAELRVEQAEAELKKNQMIYENEEGLVYEEVRESEFTLRNRQLEARMAAAEVERIRRLVEHTEKAADPDNRRREIRDLQHSIAERAGGIERLIIEMAQTTSAADYGELARQRRLYELQLREQQARLDELIRRPRD